MADSKDLGVVDHRCEVFGYEGLFCIDSSAIPTSLGVNPSLTISAVSRASRGGARVARGATSACPRRRRAFEPRTPDVYVGERVVPSAA